MSRPLAPVSSLDLEKASLENTITNNYQETELSDKIKTNGHLLFQNWLEKLGDRRGVVLDVGPDARKRPQVNDFENHQSTRPSIEQN